MDINRADEAKMQAVLARRDADRYGNLSYLSRVAVLAFGLVTVGTQLSDDPNVNKLGAITGGLGSLASVTLSARYGRRAEQKDREATSFDPSIQ
ncbi:MAG: hypothetical protein H6857_00725 [Rhodospirillales bacterium]|nr:hypothetical protein [Rhodospirillales bacterium]MCB9979787.1 hypothetical protein [Rhodospirillales bacterium]